METKYIFKIFQRLYNQFGNLRKTGWVLDDTTVRSTDKIKNWDNNKKLLIFKKIQPDIKYTLNGKK